MNFIIMFLTIFCGLNFNTNNSANVNYDSVPEEQSMIINQVGSIETKYNQVYSAYLPDDDHFEPNDNFSDASKICPDDFYLKDSYSINVDATLGYGAMIQDIDFYYLTIFTD